MYSLLLIFTNFF